jgi:predicted nucleic acid-binding protein
MIPVDSNVIIDVLTQDPTWRAWSEAAPETPPKSPIFVHVAQSKIRSRTRGRWRK